MRITRLGPADVYALTGITAAEVDRITTITDPGHRPERPPGLTHRDRVLLTLIALRTNLTERAQAAIFDISQPTAHRIIRDLTAAVAGLFVPDQFDDTDILLLDGTLIRRPRPVHHPTEQELPALGQHSGDGHPPSPDRARRQRMAR